MDFMAYVDCMPRIYPSGFNEVYHKGITHPLKIRDVEIRSSNKATTSFLYVYLFISYFIHLKNQRLITMRLSYAFYYTQQNQLFSFMCVPPHIS